MNELRRLIVGETGPGRRLVVVTARGVEIPIGRTYGWTVAAFTGLLGEIDGLPETQHPLGASA